LKEFKYIDFAVSGSLKPKCRRLLARLNITSRTADVREFDGYFGVRLPIDDPRLERLGAELDKMLLDPPWDCRIEVEYERKDLEPCHYVSLRIDRVPKGDTGPMYDTEYDMSGACPKCGTGFRQVSPLRIHRSQLPKKARAVRTYQDEILIDNDLATDIMLELGSDRGLRQIEDRRMRDLLPWWQILPDTSMPPADPATGLDASVIQCQRCKRDGFGSDRPDWRPIELAYRMSERDRASLPDFVWTWETFGKSQLRWEPRYRIGLQNPDILISNRVMRVFWAKKVRGVKFIPVRFL
jgi:hypothetical protein